MFPIRLWYRLLEQAQIIFNMLGPSRFNPNISEHTIMEGNFDFKKTPLSPPCTKVVFHEKPKEVAYGYNMRYKAG